MIPRMFGIALNYIQTNNSFIMLTIFILLDNMRYIMLLIG